MNAGRAETKYRQKGAVVSDKQTLERDLLREALGPTEGCPPLEKLESALVHGATGLASELAEHLKTCGYCQTELHLLRDFQQGGPEKDSEEVRKVVELLRGRSKETFQPRSSAIARESWWSRRPRFQWLVPATLGMAALLIVVGGVSQYRRATTRPALNGSFQVENEVLRTGSFAVVKPVGDLVKTPGEVQWEAVQGAAKYEVRLLEVDGAEVWKAETTSEHTEIPRTVQDKIAPAKTLFCEVVAFDSSGHKIGDTGTVRFRLVLHGGAR